MTINQREKQRLRNASESVYDQLQSQDGAEHFTWSRRLSGKSTWTDGWSVTLGSLGRNQPHLELGLDRGPRRSGRDFCFGFGYPQRQVMCRLLKRLPKRLSPMCGLTTVGYEETSPGVWLLLVPLKRAEFSRPICGHYRGIDFFLAMHQAELQAILCGFITMKLQSSGALTKNPLSSRTAAVSTEMPRGLWS
jgi:hypothetical protein